MNRLEKRVSKLADKSVVALGARVFTRIQDKMWSLGWDANRYGWDWPTAFVLHPRLVNRYNALRGEASRRSSVAGSTIIEWVASL